MPRSSSGDKSPAPGISRSITNFGIAVLQSRCVQARQIYKPQSGVAAQVFVFCDVKSSNQKGKADRRLNPALLRELAGGGAKKVLPTPPGLLTSFARLNTIAATASKHLLASWLEGETIMSRRLPKRVNRAGGVPKGPESAPGSEMRQQILKTAIQLFAQKGFRGTTTREIALAAGVNEVTIFRHFASKQELYSAILEIKSSEAGLTSWLVDLAEFAERRDDAGLFLFVASNILAHYRRDSDFLSLKLYSSLEGHELAQKYRERQICPLFRFLRGYIKKRQSEGAFNRCNPDIAVQAFLGSVYNHAMCLHFSDVDFITLSEEETAKAFTALFLGGMRRNSSTAAGRGRSVSRTRAVLNSRAES